MNSLDTGFCKSLILVGLLVASGSSFAIENIVTASKILQSQQKWAICRMEHDIGRGRAEIQFQRYAYDCASYHASARVLADNLEKSRVLLIKTQQTFNDVCYRSGWLMGMVSSSRKLIETCNVQLSDARVAAISKRVEECRAVGDLVKADEDAIQTMLDEDLEVTAKEDERFSAKFFLYTMLGSSDIAWEMMLEKQRNQDYGALPCSLLLYPEK